MQLTDLFTGKSARSLLTKGVKGLYTAVASTLGPGGKNVMFQPALGHPQITKDGVTVARWYNSNDSKETAGVLACKQAALKANQLAGDGTTSSTVLTYHLLKEAISLVDSGANPHLLKKGMNMALEDLKGVLHRSSKQITSPEELEKIAIISANDKELGKLVADAFNQAGEKGFVTFDTKSNNQKCYIDLTDGMKFEACYDSPLYLRDPVKKHIVYEDALVFVIDKVITNPNDTLLFLEGALTPYAQHNKPYPPIVIISRGVQGDALSTLIGNFKENNLSIVSLIPLASGNTGERMFRDIAAFTGAEYVPETLCKNIGDLDTQKIAGKVKKIAVSNEECTLVGVESNLPKLKEYIQGLEDADDSLENKERISRLNAQIATIQVGALMYSEVAEIRDRVEDAINACRAALEEGIVVGGGIALYKAANNLDNITVFLKGTEKDVVLGYKTLLKICNAVTYKILENSGVYSTSSIEHKVRTLFNRPFIDPKKIGSNQTIDGLTGNIVDAYEQGIVDPVKVVVTSLDSAVSVAGLYMTTECLLLQKLDT